MYDLWSSYLKDANVFYKKELSIYKNSIKEVWDLMWLKEISTNYKTSWVSRFVTPHKKVSIVLWDW